MWTLEDTQDRYLKILERDVDCLEQEAEGKLGVVILRHSLVKQ